MCASMRVVGSGGGAWMLTTAPPAFSLAFNDIIGRTMPVIWGNFVSPNHPTWVTRKILLRDPKIDPKTKPTRNVWFRFTLWVLCYCLNTHHYSLSTTNGRDAVQLELCWKNTTEGAFTKLLDTHHQTTILLLNMLSSNCSYNKYLPELKANSQLTQILIDTEGYITTLG